MGQALTGVTAGGQQQFANGAVLSVFKLVIGADDYADDPPTHREKVPRVENWPETPLYDTAATKVGAGSSLSIGSGKYTMTQQRGDCSYGSSFGLRVPKHFVRDGTIDLQNVEATRRLLLSDLYADWSEDYKDLIRPATDLHVWPLHTLSIENFGWKSVSGKTLAGDAAHLSFPAGKSVNLAMTVSLKLASKIAEYATGSFDPAAQDPKRLLNS